MTQNRPNYSPARVRNAQACLILLGSLCLGFAGASAVRWSLRYSGGTKFTALGIMCILAATVAFVSTVWQTIRKREE